MKQEPTLNRRAKHPIRATRETTSALPASVSFPIAGIGASAGGLEALEQFLGHVPAGSGLGLVIVQHLDPTLKGIMPELLRRATGMKVVQVKDRTTVRPDCVYVIPPNRDMSMRYRSDLLGAALTIASKRRGGTVVKCCYPVAGKYHGTRVVTGKQMAPSRPPRPSGPAEAGPCPPARRFRGLIVPPKARALAEGIFEVTDGWYLPESPRHE
jgi:hypothetical protein